MPPEPKQQQGCLVSGVFLLAMAAVFAATVNLGQSLGGGLGVILGILVGAAIAIPVGGILVILAIAATFKACILVEAWTAPPSPDLLAGPPRPLFRHRVRAWSLIALSSLIGLGMAGWFHAIADNAAERRIALILLAIMPVGLPLLLAHRWYAPLPPARNRSATPGAPPPDPTNPP